MRQIIPFVLVALLITACSNDQNNTLNETAAPTRDYVKEGNDITNATQMVLLKNVANGLKTNGPAATVEFCNTHASRLVDSLSIAHNANISRISAKNRNPENAPDKFESRLLASMEQNNIADTLVGTVYYKSIKIGMQPCLKCHGIPEEQINGKTLSTLQSLYPNDKATGYKLGDFRGAWKVKFE
jgi:hypothetical protein